MKFLDAVDLLKVMRTLIFQKLKSNCKCSFLSGFGNNFVTASGHYPYHGMWKLLSILVSLVNEVSVSHTHT